MKVQVESCLMFKAFLRRNELSLSRKLEFSNEIEGFERWLKFETQLKYGWFHLKLYSMLQDLSLRSIETDFLVDLRRSSNS